MRCDEFYEKWRQVGNFCEKHPRTAEQIEAFLDKIIPLLEAEITKSEILAPINPAMAEIITERASRPLISEKDPEVKKDTIQQIVNKKFYGIMCSCSKNAIEPSQRKKERAGLFELFRLFFGQEIHPTTGKNMGMTCLSA